MLQVKAIYIFKLAMPRATCRSERYMYTCILIINRSTFAFYDRFHLLHCMMSYNAADDIEKHSISSNISK